MPADEAPRAGVIGLGVIGGGVAVSMARSGQAPAAVYDIRPEAATGLDGVPASVSSPAEVARQSDVVLIAVVDAAQAEEVLSGDDGVLAPGRDDIVVVLLSTVSIDSVHHLSGLCQSRGAVLLDAGVTAGARAAQNGLVVMVGGPDESVRRAMPVLDAFAQRVVHCGELGTGMVTKLARNVVIYGEYALAHHAASLARAGGVPLERLLEVLEESSEDGAVDPLVLLRLLVADTSVPEESAAKADEVAQKDLAAVQEFAAASGLHTALVDLLRPRMRDIYAGILEEPLPNDVRERGLEMLDRTYGEGFSANIPPDLPVPSIDHTVEQLFANVWARPYLTVRDRRLFVLGITAMLGRADLVETQLRGALANGELTHPQLRELALQGAYYAGWGNGTVLQSVVEKLVAEEARAER